MQVVELGDGGVARAEHRGERIRGNRAQGVGAERVGQRVHALAPRPEVARRPHGVRPTRPSRAGTRASARSASRAARDRRGPPRRARSRRPARRGSCRRARDRSQRRAPSRPGGALGARRAACEGQAPRTRLNPGPRREDGRVGPFDTLWYNARLATMEPGGAPYGAIAGRRDRREGRRDRVGRPARGLPGAPERLAARAIDAGGRWITPGLIDPHTHLVFGGDRVADFERRVGGESYVAAAGSGSGIAYTVASTRAASDEQSCTMRRRRACARWSRTGRRRSRSSPATGSTSRPSCACSASRAGWASEPASRCARRTSARTSCRRSTRGRRDEYVALVCDEMLPRVARDGLGRRRRRLLRHDRVHARRDRARAGGRACAGLAVKVHADQIADTGAAALAARCGALSADHLEHTGTRASPRWRAPGTVAVLLPGAYYSARDGEAAGRGLRAHGVPIALATDCNPGTSPILTLPTVLNMACVLFGLTPGGGRCRRDAQRRARARAGRPRHAPHRNAVRPRAMGHRIARRAVLLARREPLRRRGRRRTPDRKGDHR